MNVTSRRAGVRPIEKVGTTSHDERTRGRIARDGGLKRRTPERDPPHRFRENTTVQPSWQPKTEEKEGGGEGMKAIATTAPNKQSKHHGSNGAKRAGERGDPRAEQRIEKHEGHRRGRRTRESETDACLLLRGMHAVVRGPQYEHAVGEIAAGDRQQRSG